MALKPVHREDRQDREWIRRVADERDTSALEALYRRFRGPLGTFLGRMLAEAIVVDEVFNEVMWTVWRKASTYNGKSRVSTWLYSIAYRQALSALRRYRPRYTDSVEADEVAAPEGTSLPDADLVRKALGQLSADHRLVIELVYFEGRQYDEVAEIADCPLNTVKSRMFHARKRLKTVLADLGESL
ncbi:MAG: sigma-70 family RNA polymerase sigma factor [Pseudomonadota bacterium]